MRGQPPASLPGVIELDGVIVEVINQPGYLTVSTVLWGPIEIIKLHTSRETWNGIISRVGEDEKAVHRVAAAGVGLACRLAGEAVTMTSWRRIVYTSAAVAGRGMEGWSLAAERGINIDTAPAWSIYAAATASLARRRGKEEREQWEAKLSTPMEGEHILAGLITDDTKKRQQPDKPKKPPRAEIDKRNAKQIEMLKMMS